MIDIVILGKNDKTIHWNLGKSIYAGESLSHIDLLSICKSLYSEYILIINLDYFSMPKEDHILSIINTSKADIWHAGLKCGLQGEPAIINHIVPTWIYNLDAPNTISSTSWRISIECVLAKRSVLIEGPRPYFSFQSKTMIGLDWGFRLIKNGVIVRYEPNLSNFTGNLIDYAKVPYIDNFKFVKRNFSNKWFWWSGYRKWVKSGRSFELIRAMLSNLGTKRVIDPFYKHESILPSTDVPTVAVFTPTLDRYSYLIEELKQLRLQTILPTEIFVTDQTDIERRDHNWLNNFNDLPIIYQPQNEKGQCNAWNYCLTNAKSNYFLFLGDDADEIPLDFIQSLYSTMILYDSDMVACNIKEREYDYPYKQPDIFISDTFPICLVKRSVFEEIGGYDYAYNKGIRADADVAIRMHLAGKLMILNPNIKIHHHRAPIGGLRSHNERKITRSMSRRSIWIFQLPSFTEFYQAKRYFSMIQCKEMIAIKKMSLGSIEGGILLKILKLLVYLLKYRSINRQIKDIQSRSKELLRNFPVIPDLHSNQQ